MWWGMRLLQRTLLGRYRYSTVFALSSGQGKCGVAVIRVSGRQAADAILRMTKRTTLPQPRTAVLTAVIDPNTKEQIDRGLVLWFPGPRSFTGEDSCELQVHGGPAVVAAVLAGLSTIPSFKPAGPGDFTKRAFLAGRMDLTAVEGLADLIHAETEQQRRQALLQMEGSLANLYGQWRTQLIRCVAHVEAYIDFSEDENIEEGVLEQTQTSLHELAHSVSQHLQDGRRGERLHNGVRTAILGEPNVGKSSLLNYLVGRAAAIVAPVAGTTRDVVEVPINVAGFPMLLADTAGQRTSPTDDVEREGIRRAQNWAKTSDLIIIVLDARQVVATESWKDYQNEYQARLELDTKIETLPVINKIDLLTDEEKKRLVTITNGCACCVSCTSGAGLTDLITTLTTKLEKLCGNPSRESPSLTQERHRHHLTHCLNNLEQGITLCSESDASLAAHCLRKALRHLGNVTGHVTTEHILDVVFKDFCVGK